MKHIPLLLPFFFALSGCVNPIIETRPIHLTSKDVAEVEEAVKYDLVEPNSARFRNIRAAVVVRQDGTSVRTVCGEVNSRNRMGGYSGAVPFSAELTPSGAISRGVDNPTDKIGVVNAFYCDPVFGEGWRNR